MATATTQRAARMMLFAYDRAFGSKNSGAFTVSYAQIIETVDTPILTDAVKQALVTDCLKIGLICSDLGATFLIQGMRETMESTSGRNLPPDVLTEIFSNTGFRSSY